MTRRFRQVAIPGDKASWTEYFYTGSLRVTNGVCETDNPHWISQLLATGWKEIDAPTAIAEEPQAVEEVKPVVKTQARRTRAQTARTR